MVEVEHQEEKLEKDEKVVMVVPDMMVVQMVRKAHLVVEVKVVPVGQLVEIITENRTVEKEEIMDMQ